MNIRDRAESTAKSVCEALHAKPSADLQKQVADLIERALADATIKHSEECAKVIMGCCSADQDLAHKIAEEIRRKNTALIANLSSMR